MKVFHSQYNRFDQEVSLIHLSIINLFFEAVTTPLTNFLNIWSGTLREELHRASADECENITGAFVTSNASTIV